MRIGKYKVEGEIGRGGFGRVFRAFDPAVGRAVAIKVLNPGADETLLTRFRNEAATAGNLQHKNIVTVYDFGDQDGKPYLVMELLKGEDLQKLIQQDRAGSLLQKVQIMSQVAAGLQSAHSKGVVHLDVKPANIMVLPDGNVKIMDFGIARLTTSPYTSSSPGSFDGSVLYMSPEQFGDGPIDALCDIWGFGVTYYELITGRHPFPAEEPAVAVYQIQNVTPQPVDEIVPNCPGALGEIVSRAHAKNRYLRYQCLEDLQIDVEPILQQLRKREAQILTAKTQELAARNDWESVSTLVKQILDLDSGNQIARQLRDKAREHTRTLAARTPAKSGALQSSVHAVQGPAPSPEQIQKQRRAARLEQARIVVQRFIEARDFDTALQKIEVALRLEPGDDGLVALQHQAKAGKDAHEREAAILDALRKTEELARSKHLTNALASITQAAESYPNDPRIRTIRDRLLEYTRRQDSALIRKTIADAQELRKRGDVDSAIGLLQSQKARFPDFVELRSAYEAARSEKAARDEQVAAVSIERARRLEQDGEKPAAWGIIARALAAHPDSESLRAYESRLLSRMTDADRGYAAVRERADIGDLIAARSYQDALDRLEHARSAGIVDESFDQLYERVQSIMNEVSGRYVARIQAALESGSLADAEEILFEGLRILPQDKVLGELTLEINWPRTQSRAQNAGGKA